MCGTHMAPLAVPATSPDFNPNDYFYPVDKLFGCTFPKQQRVSALGPETKHACAYCKTHHNEPVRCPSCAAPNAE